MAVILAPLCEEAIKNGLGAGKPGGLLENIH